jgi:hypothetical protein
MKEEIRLTSTLGILAILSVSAANEETPLPLGASDLVPDKRFDQFRTKETKIEPISWKWSADSVQLVYESDDSTLGEFKFADQWAIAELQLENQKLKEKVSELESRLSKLEGLLAPEERTSRGSQ